MSIELSHLMQVILGQRPVLTVADLPRPVADHLKAMPAIVFLRNRELEHILRDHTYITPFNLMQLPDAIRSGAYYEDPKRPNCVTCLYRSRAAAPCWNVMLVEADHGLSGR